MNSCPTRSGSDIWARIRLAASGAGGWPGDVFGEESGASLGRLPPAVSLDGLDDGPLDEPGNPGGEWPEPLSTAEHAVTTRTSRVPAAPRRTLRIGTAQLSQLDLRG
jgi:hypothetical protein